MFAGAARGDLVKAVLLLALLGGCAAQTGSEAASEGLMRPPAGSASEQVATEDPVTATPTSLVAACAHIYRGAAVATLSAAETLTQVRVCVEDPLSGKVSTKTLTAAESQETLDWLAGLLAEPSASRDESLICTAELRRVPDFVVTTQSGTLIAPIIPTDPCGKPSLEVVKLLEQIASQ